ncbi:MAG: hypothetical protein AAF657_38820 [Acidobacteriota bacterium]
MSIEVLIKEPHKDFLDQVVDDHGLSSCQEAVTKLVTFASKDDPESNEDFFEYRCVGNCHYNDIPVALDVSADAIEYLKRMIQQYDLEDYETEEERLGKALRCLVNYADQDGDPESIFTKGSS